MKKKILVAGVAATFILAAGFLYEASAQSISGSIRSGAITYGTPARATVYLSLPAGLHVNSNHPNSEYAIPTNVRVSSMLGVRAGPVSYPRGHSRKFGFSETPINVRGSGSV